MLSVWWLLELKSEHKEKEIVSLKLKEAFCQEYNYLTLNINKTSSMV